MVILRKNTLEVVVKNMMNDKHIELPLVLHWFLIKFNCKMIIQRINKMLQNIYWLQEFKKLVM